jgi:hypothetical protein
LTRAISGTGAVRTTRAAEIGGRLVGGGLESVGPAAEIGAGAKSLVPDPRQHDRPQAGVLMRHLHRFFQPDQ